MRRWRKMLSVLGLLVLGLGGLMPVMAGSVPAARAGADPAAAGGVPGPACELLDDPGVRVRMSALGEEALLEACGRPLPSPPSPSATPPLPAPEKGGVSAADVRVNGVDPAAASTTQSETSLSINRTTGTLCAHWNDSYHYLVQGLSYIGFARSTDGGQTWQDGPTNYLPEGGGGKARGDPSVAWRALDNRWYATSIHLGGSQGLGFWQSTDDCATFQWVGMAHAGSADDKELLVIDNSPFSPHYGRMYIAWTDFAAGMSAIYSDNGTAWSTPFILSYDSVQGAWPAVAPNGDVYVAWVRWTTGDFMDMEVSRSTNGGVSFSRVTNPATNAIVPYDVGASQQCGRDALNGRIRYLPSPQIAVGPDGCLHVVYPRDPDGHGTGDVINSYYRRSCNNGATWEAERLLNDDGTLTDQFFPNVTVNENNLVAASWYDRRLDAAGNLLFDRYWTYSLDGGQTWQPNERVSDVSSPVYIDPNMSTCYHGDYDQIASDASSVHIIWSDDRVYFNGHYDPDIWFERMALDCDPVVGADFSWEPVTPTAGQPVVFTGTAWDGAGGGWMTETVEADADVGGGGTSLALDTAGRPHISYHDGTTGTLRYASFDGAAWTSELVDAGAGEDMGRMNSLALDAAGRPHISYYVEGASYDLKYAYFDGSSWHVETVDGLDYDVGWYSSLALDAAGRPHIAYLDSSNGDLKYAWHDGSAWHIEVADAGAYLGMYNSLALDAAGRPHIAYYDGANGDLKYNYFDGTTWHPETVDSSGDVGLFASLALDAAGRPHASYCLFDPGSGNCEDLKYAWYDGSSWQVETVDAAGQVGGYSSLALDGASHPHIGYYDYTLGRLLYAWNDGSGWQSEEVEGAGDVGRDISLALDAAGRPHLSYASWTDGTLRYARRDVVPPTEPVVYTWDLGDGTYAAGEAVTHSYSLPGVYTVALTATNCLTATAMAVHTINVTAAPPCTPVTGADFSWSPPAPVVSESMAFTATSWGIGGGWQVELADPAGRVGYYTSLALDAAGRPHVAYQDWDSGLKYAYDDGTGWISETLDNSGFYNYPSLALDAQGRPHIAYWHVYSGQLKYVHYDGTAWQFEIVESDLYDVGEDLALVLDSAGRPCVAYADNSAQDLKYTCNDGTGWQVTVVEHVGAPAANVAMGLDLAGVPHIGYRVSLPPPSMGALRYAYLDGAGWVTATVDGVSGDLSLALDTSSHPYISYAYTDALRYASFDGLGWTVVTVTAEPWSGWQSALRLDAQDRPHIAFTWANPGGGGALRYAWHDGATWHVDTVDDQPGGEWAPALALGAAGEPHVTYWSSGDNDLFYAWYSAAPPTPPISYTWSLGDGTYAAGEGIDHGYSLPGVYTVVLTATNCATATATAVHTITVVQPPCEPVHDAAFTWTPLTPTVGQQVTFIGTATGTLPITYTWDWGDGAGPHPYPPSPPPPLPHAGEGEGGGRRPGGGGEGLITHTYALPGLYTVTLTAANCATATAVVTRELTVLPPPCEPVHDAAFTWTPLTPTVGQQVTFIGTATGTLPITYTWDWGDGAGPHPYPPSPPPPLPHAGEGEGGGRRPGGGGEGLITHTYALPGLYTVTLTAANCATATSTAVHTLTVLPPCDPVEIITVTRAVSGCAVTLGAELTGTAPFTYLWAAGALTSTLPAPTFAFGASGTYTVTLAVSNCGGGDVWMGPVTVVCPGPRWTVYLPLVYR